MSDNEKEEEEAPFYIDRAKGGRAACKGCKQKCLDADLRIAKLVASPYSDGKKMKSWFHVDCIMTAFLKQRPTTKRIDGPEDVGNWENISQEDKDLVLEKLQELEKLCTQKYGDKAVKANKPPPKPKAEPKTDNTQPGNSEQDVTPSKPNAKIKDNLFKEFRRLCVDLMNNDAYTAKTAVIKKLFSEGVEGNGFKSDITLWCRLLLPGAVKRVYNLKSKQLVKLFARMFRTDHDDMLTDLQNGDVAETIRIFHEKSNVCTPATKSILTMNDIDDFLQKLSTLTKEDEQVFHFKSILKQCTSNDLKMIVRLVKGDLRINAGPKPILDAIHPDAYKIFQTSRDIDAVIARVLTTNKDDSGSSPVKKTIKANVILMTPVLPMLAEACKSVEMAMKKCPNGMFSEIKYDGERVQLHKEGSEFKYFSRALKPVMPHKINRFKDFIPKAFPHAKDLVLDAEVLMVDTQTGKPLPFGSLGAHKKSEFKDAEVCLFVFDCIYYNGEILIDKPMKQRRKILEDNMIEIKNHVMFSEMELIRKPADLANMIAKVLKLGLEGLVLKDLESKYEPGKRHWLKVKKDYLFGGAMADSADLVVLGAWFGSGKKGGMLSVFLMGCHDAFKDKWLTVTKVHTGHDDKSLEALQGPLRAGMDLISQDSNRVPSWLKCTNTMVPDFVAKDPKKQPVWEITGTELTQAQIHTADGISVRFPRVTRIRDDKTWDTATNLKELKLLYKNSKEHTDVSLLNKLAAEAEQDEIDELKNDKNKVNKNANEKKETNRKIDKFFKKEKTETKTTVKMEVDKEDNEDKPDLSKVKLKRKISDDAEDLKPSPKKYFKPEKDDSDVEIVDVLKDKTSPKHSPVKDFAHLPITPNPLIKTKLSPSKPLPNVFNDLVLSFYSDACKNLTDIEIKNYKRHWLAYGGTLDDSMPASGATHVIHYEPEVSVKDLTKTEYKFSNSARHVTVDWLKQSLARKKVSDVISFTVKLRSS